MTDATMRNVTTRRTIKISSEPVATTNLLGAFRDAEANVQCWTTAFGRMTRPSSEEASIDALIDWALSRDFGPDGGDRIRDEAWGDRAGE
jgi:hypothetical protein